jgi:hypothetical protein
VWFRFLDHWQSDISGRPKAQTAARRDDRAKYLGPTDRPAKWTFRLMAGIHDEGEKPAQLPRLPERKTAEEIAFGR